jgi:hypothetical protein
MHSQVKDGLTAALAAGVVCCTGSWGAGHCMLLGTFLLLLAGAFAAVAG